MDASCDNFCKKKRIIRIFHVNIYGFLYGECGIFNMFTFPLLHDLSSGGDCGKNAFASLYLRSCSGPIGEKEERGRSEVKVERVGWEASYNFSTGNSCLFNKVCDLCSSI